MDFSLSDDQLAMRAMTERVFDDLCSDDAMKALTQRDQASSLHSGLWAQMAELGILGIAIDEAHNGLGMGLLELCLMIEQQGRKAAPIPMLDTLVVAAQTIQDSERADIQSAVLPKIAAGEYIFSSVRPYQGLQDAEPFQISAEGDGFSLKGRSGFCTYLQQADGYLIGSAEEEDAQQTILWIDAGSEGATIVPQIGINDEPGGFVIFSNTKVAADRVIATGEMARTLLSRQSQRLAIAIAALQVGLLEEGLKRAAAYVSERKQFGRPLGTFQAVSQQAADAYMEIESLRSVYWRALDHVEQGDDLALSASTVRYWINQAAHKVAHTFLHLHGGIGQDLDYPIHRFFLWAKHYERALGGAEKIALQTGDLFISQLKERLRDF